MLHSETRVMKPSILLVNDIPDHVRPYEAALRARGYDFQLSTTGADTLRTAQRLRPDCIVIDVRLVDMPGWELCRRLKAERGVSQIPVVMLVPDVSRQSLERSREVGCASWLTRPGVPDDLVRAIEHVLAQGSVHPGMDDALINACSCPACESEDVRAGVRVGPVQYFTCKSCQFRWRVDAEGTATA
jgi:two-component system cell cycle response regulator DivK